VNGIIHSCMQPDGRQGERKEREREREAEIGKQSRESTPSCVQTSGQALHTRAPANEQRSQRHTVARSGEEGEKGVCTKEDGCQLLRADHVLLPHDVDNGALVEVALQLALRLMTHTNCGIRQPPEIVLDWIGVGPRH
jgi:hypothetical protein